MAFHLLEPLWEDLIRGQLWHYYEVLSTSSGPTLPARPQALERSPDVLGGVPPMSLSGTLHSQ